MQNDMLKLNRFWMSWYRMLPIMIMPISHWDSRCGASKSFCAVPTLKQKSFPSGNARKALAQHVNFSRKDQGWGRGELGTHRSQGLRVVPLGLLLNRQGTPGVQAFHNGWIRRYHLF